MLIVPATAVWSMPSRLFPADCLVTNAHATTASLKEGRGNFSLRAIWKIQLSLTLALRLLFDALTKATSCPTAH